MKNVKRNWLTYAANIIAYTLYAVFTTITAALLYMVYSPLKPTKYESLEAERLTAQLNAEYNAKKWLIKNKAGFQIVNYTEPTISKDCPQGDGWATVSIMKEGDKEQLKCSTIVASIGCYLGADFEKNTLFPAGNKCQRLEKRSNPLIIRGIPIFLN